jgi:regulator of sigma E protease
MDLFSVVPVYGFMALGYIVPALIAFTVIVFIHEYGHFKVARLCGFKVDVFSVGFGKEIAGFNDRYGTRWKFCWIPLGGYVKFAGDANAASMPERREKSSVAAADDFHLKPVWQRALVVAAGPFANFILAVFIYAATFMFVGVSASEPKIFEVIPGSVAEEAGFKSGDVITAINGKEIKTFRDIQEMVVTRAGDRLVFSVSRGGQGITVEATPRTIEQTDEFGNKMRLGQLGIKQDPNAQIIIEKLGPLSAVGAGVEQTWNIIETTLRYIGKVITGRESADQLGGIGSITKAAGDAASMGPDKFIFLIGFLSVSIGLINLFPIPMLDGGHLVYYAIEAVRGKPLGPNAQEWGFRIGFAMVIGLMLLGNWNDVVRWLT